MSRFLEIQTIRCPKCKTDQMATVKISWLEPIYKHVCNCCKHIITKEDWELASGAEKRDGVLGGFHRHVEEPQEENRAAAN